MILSPHQRAKVLFANVAVSETTPGEVDFSITFRDSQNIHILEEKASRVLASLHSNSQAISSLYRKLHHKEQLYRSRKSELSTASSVIVISEHLPLRLKEIETLKRHISPLILRIQGVAKLVSYLREFSLEYRPMLLTNQHLS